MAAIDKIYGTAKERDEFKEWCQENKPEALRFFYSDDCYVGPDDDKRAITNLPANLDFWMLNNCDLDWVVERIKDQYGLLDTP